MDLRLNKLWHGTQKWFLPAPPPSLPRQRRRRRHIFRLVMVTALPHTEQYNGNYLTFILMDFSYHWCDSNKCPNDCWAMRSIRNYKKYLTLFSCLCVYVFVYLFVCWLYVHLFASFVYRNGFGEKTSPVLNNWTVLFRMTYSFSIKKSNRTEGKSPHGVQSIMHDNRSKI